mmetsp:Transcript_26106/g.36373  ORF Transcript_26106/g.36373 Transcript_26106/m.36373 type:complete len:278 (+) Transcript_26106:450-1283(+)
MRKGIDPCWECEANRWGGRWAFTVPDARVNETWAHLVRAAVKENLLFTSNLTKNQISGVSIQFEEGKQTVVKIWNRDYTISGIGLLKKIPGIHFTNYRPHNIPWDDQSPEDLKHTPMHWLNVFKDNLRRRKSKCTYFESALNSIASPKRFHYEILFHNYLLVSLRGMLPHDWDLSDPEKAETVIDRMLKAGFMPQLKELMLLLLAYTRQSKLTDTYRILKRMESLGLRPTEETYNSVLNRLLLRKSDKGRLLLKQMTEAGIPIERRNSALLSWRRPP